MWTRSLDDGLRCCWPGAHLRRRHENRTSDCAVGVCLILILRTLYSGLIAVLIRRTNVGTLNFDVALIGEMWWLIRSSLRRIAVDKDKHFLLALVNHVPVRMEEARASIMIQAAK